MDNTNFVNYLVRQAGRLPVGDRQVVVDAILESIQKDSNRPTAQDRLKQLIPIGEFVFGVVYDERRKSNGDAYIRNMCAKVMRDEEYTFSSIGRAMKRHPSSVMTMVHRADEMRDGYFGHDFVDMYNLFMKMK